MQASGTRNTTVFGILVAALAFYGALPFWGTLSEGQISEPDWIAPIAYGFAALFGCWYLLRMGGDRQRPERERRLYRGAAAILVLAPFVFYYAGRLPVMAVLWPVMEWAGALALLAGLVLAARSAALNSSQRLAVIVSIVATIMAPFMPWWPRLFDAALLSGSAYDALWTYGLWIVAAVWCVSAWLMMRPVPAGPPPRQADLLAVGMERIRRALSMGVVIGLAFFLIGMYNPVQYSSETYEQSTYFAGRLTDTSIVSIADMNVTLFLGMGLIVFCLLLLLFPLKFPRRP